MDKKDLLVSNESQQYFWGLDDIIPGFSKNPYMAGPCSFESKNMIEECALKLYELGIPVIRAGIFKPRTSPYDFQGYGIQGLQLLREAADNYNLKIVCEVLSIEQINIMQPYIDILQIGSRNMYNYELLKAVGKTNIPVLLKRGLCATIEEFIYAAEYIALGGNRKIIMCERGIRSYDKETRNLFDISCIPLIHANTKLPIIADLSHSLGRKDILYEIGKSVIACNTDGIMIEMHPDPQSALSDANQQLTFAEIEKFIMENRKLIDLMCEKCVI